MNNFWIMFGGSDYSVQAPTTSQALPEAVEQHMSSKLQMKQANNGAGT